MATASTLISDLQTRLGDTAGDKFTSAVLLSWLEEAEKEFLLGAGLVLRAFNLQTVSANQDSFALPSTCIEVDSIVNHRGLTRKLKYVNPHDFVAQQTYVTNAIGDPVLWTELVNEGGTRRIYVWPRYSQASKTTTTGSTIYASVTTVNCASTGNLRSYGYVEINSEKIEYTAKTASTLTGCRRGVDQTTAASHASGDAVTQLDIEILHRREPTSLATVTQEPEISQIYHEKLKLYCQYLAYMQEGSMDKATAAYELWKNALKEAEYTAKREHLGVMRVRNQLDGGYSID